MIPPCRTPLVIQNNGKMYHIIIKLMIPINNNTTTNNNNAFNNILSLEETNFMIAKPTYVTINRDEHQFVITVTGLLKYTYACVFVRLYMCCFFLTE